MHLIVGHVSFIPRKYIIEEVYSDQTHSYMQVINPVVISLSSSSLFLISSYCLSTLLCKFPESCQILFFSDSYPSPAQIRKIDSSDFCIYVLVSCKLEILMTSVQHGLKASSSPGNFHAVRTDMRPLWLLTSWTQ